MYPQRSQTMQVADLLAQSRLKSDAMAVLSWPSRRQNSSWPQI